MACDGCGAENRQGASFCASCGSPLARRCPSCAREVAPDARFCDGCGTPLAGEAVAPAAPAVRKTVTAVFADLGGSTGFGERVDAETARSVIGRYHALLQEVVDAHGGTVAKFIGDGMLAFFGIPEVAEDDAERAVAAAAEMQRRFAAFADGVAATHGERLTFRVGVNSGEVVIGEGDADVVGDALNVAARLEKACEPGRVLVGEATWRLTRSVFGYEPLGEVTVSGRAEPVAAYVLTEDQHAAEEATPFVGRDDELARLRVALDDAVAARAARFVTVIGPPGVGKTRLSRELEESVEAEARTLHTACERAGGAAFAPLVDLIRPALGDEDPRAALAALVPAGETERDRVVDGLAGVLGVGEPRSAEETFWAVRRMVEALAADQPLILVIDDIQWAEARLLDLLEHLAEWVADAPLLLVGLARPELRELRPALAEPGRRVADVVVLDGLDAAATAQLASRMLGGADLPPELVARLPDSTDGNPLFVRELVRMLVDEGVIRRDGDEWRLTVDAEAVEVPPTIRSLLAARIERLPTTERIVLERASVVGPDFVLGALRDLVDDPDRLDGHLEALRRRDLVEPTGAYWGDDPVWRFHHVLIRDAVYGRLLKEARADLHERVGDWTTAAAEGVLGEHETTVAHHYEQAHAYRSQLGALDDHGRELGRRAAGLLGVAARRALAQDDLLAAGSLAVRALECLEEGAAERRDLLLLGAEAVLASGDLAQAPALLDGLAALGEVDEGLAAWADVYRAQWLDLTDPTRLDEVEQLADAAADRFAAAGDGSGQAKAHLVRASVLARRGRLADSEVELDRAMGAARQAEDRRRLVAALGAAPAVALWGPSPVARAGGRCLDVIRLLRITTQSPVVEATSLRHQAVLEALRGRFGPARALLAEVRATIEDLGLRRDLMEVELFEGTVDLLDGDPASAEGHLRTAHEGLASLGAAAAGGAAALLGRALLAQGRVDEAATLADEVGATAGQDLKAAIAWGAVTAEVRAARGDAAGAVAAAEEAVGLAGGTDLVLDHADALAALARVRRATGDPAGAESAEAEARRRYEEKGSTVHGDDSRVRGAGLPSARGRPGADQPGAERPSENAAVRHHTEMRVRWAAEDWDALGALLAPDMQNVDRRTGLGNEVVGRDAVLQNLQMMAELAPGGRRTAHAVLAVRGDRLALLELTLDHEAFEASSLILLELDDAGLMSRSVFFEADDLDAAMAELEARHWAQTGENAASRQQRELTERWQADGPEAVAHMLSVDHVGVDHRRGLGGETRGRVETVEQMRVMTDLLDGATLEVGEVIATRGDRLAVVRMGVRAGFEVDLVVVTEIDDDGRRCFIAQFDADDLDAAMTEMESRFGAQTGEENLAARATRELTRGWLAGGPDAVLDRYAPDCRIIDRRLGFGSELVGREEARSQLQVISDLIGDGVLELEEVVAQRGDLLVLFRQTVGGDGFEVEMLSLIEVDVDGRQVASTLYDLGDLDAAMAELEARYRASGSGTRAVRLNRTLIERWMAEGADAVDDLIAEDIHFEDRRAGLRTVLDGRAAHLANMRAVDELRGGARFVHREVVATRGDRLVLARQAVQGGEAVQIELLALAEFDADDRMCLAIMFDADDLRGALEVLFERYLQGEGAPYAQELTASTALGRAIGAADAESLGALLADDFTCVDHRLIGFGEMDRADLLEAVRTRPETVGVGTVVAAEVAVRPGLVLSAFEIRARSTTGGDQQHLGWSLIQVRDGRIDHFEAFDPDDRATAMARLDELSAGEESESEALVVRQFRRSFALVSAGDVAGAVALFADDVTNEDRRRGLGTALVGREAISAATQALYDTLQGATIGVGEVLATRGEHLALVRLDTVGSLGPTVQSYAVAACDPDGRLIASVVFDLEALGGAVVELDRRYAAGEGVAFADEITLSSAFGQAVAAGDADALAPLLAEDFVCADHRAIGWGERDRATFLAAVGARPDTLGSGVGVSAELHLRPGLVLAPYEIWTRSATGSDLQEVGVSVTQVRDGQVVRLELFGEEDGAAADARFAELAASGSGPGIANAATRRLAPYADRFARRDREWLGELWAEEVRNDDRRSGANSGVSVGREPMLALTESLADSGFTSMHQAPVAVRGDELALYLRTWGHEDGFELAVLALMEVDAAGHLVANTMWEPDDLEAAVDELDRRFAEGEGAAHADDLALCVACGRALAAGDAEALDALLADDFVLVDHLPLRGGFGEISRAEFLLVVADRPAVMGTGVGFYRAHHRIESGLVLSEYELRSRSDRGFDATELGLARFVIRDGRIARIESFPVEDRGAAEARFDELAAEPQEPAENLATRWTRDLIRRWMSDGPDALRDLLRDDHRMVDRRPGLGSATEGAEVFVDNLRAIDELRGEQEFQLFGILAQRGSRLVLVDQGFEGDMEVHTYVVNEVDDAGLGVRSDIFEPEDLAAALAELDRRYLAGEGAEHPAVVTVVSEWSQRMARRDWDATAALMSSSFVAVDHRTMGHGELGFEERLARDRALAEAVPDAITFITDVLETAPRAALLRGGWLDTASDGAGFSTGSLVVVTVDAEGRMHRLEAFPEADLLAARACFEALRSPV